MTRDPVLKYAYQARISGQKYGIPPEVLLGLVHVESGGDINAVSAVGAFGLTQFMPGTAAGYGVKRGDAVSQIDGAARYLHALGYAKNPRLALASYNAGPGNPGAAGNYPDLVLAASSRYTGLGPSAVTSATQGAARPAGTSSDPFTKHSSGALRALLTISLVGAGATLVYLGVARTAGVQHPIRTPVGAAGAGVIAMPK